MPRPTARVLALLELLQAGGTHPAEGLAQRLGVDERTVRRYVAHLQELDVPVRAVRGRHGGYRLAAGYRLPPLMLTDEEAVAVLFSLDAVRRDADLALAPGAVTGAAAKVRRVLPGPLLERVESLERSVQVPPPAGAPAGRPAEHDPPGTGLLLLLAAAVRDRHPVALQYTDRHGRRTARTVEPLGLIAHARRWYLAATDRTPGTEGEQRTLRVDRIGLPRVLTGSFPVPERLEPAAMVLDSLARTPWQHEVVVRVQGELEDLAERLPAGLATLEQVEDDTVRLTLRAERLDWVPALLAGLDRAIEIERPAALRDLVRELADRLLAGSGPAPV